MALERLYNIPLRKEFLKAAKYKRAAKAIRAIRAFIARHMKAEPENIRIGKWLNEEIWHNGVKNPPHHIKVKTIKDDKNIVTVELAELSKKAQKMDAAEKARKEEFENKKKDEKKKETKEEKAEKKAEEAAEKEIKEEEKEEEKEKDKIMHKEIETSAKPAPAEHKIKSKHERRVALKK